MPSRPVAGTEPKRVRFSPLLSYFIYAPFYPRPIIHPRRVAGRGHCRQFTSVVVRCVSRFVCLLACYRAFVRDRYYCVFVLFFLCASQKTAVFVCLFLICMVFSFFEETISLPFVGRNVKSSRPSSLPTPVSVFQI